MVEGAQISEPQQQPLPPLRSAKGLHSLFRYLPHLFQATGFGWRIARRAKSQFLADLHLQPDNHL